jgi:hypothetical protein
MKLRQGIYQAVTQVNVLSPEIFDFVEADTFHIEGRQHYLIRYWQESLDYRGPRQQHDIRWKMHKLGRSIKFSIEYGETSQRRQESSNDLVEVGLTHSTLKLGKPITRGRGQQLCNNLSGSV